MLSQIGLTNSDIKVYFALLELESSTVGPIIKKSLVPDSKIYAILEKLKGRGLVSFVIKNNVKHFQCSDPKNLISIIDDKEKMLQKQKKELQEEIIPQIEIRRKLTEDKQEATVYEGYEGFRAAMHAMLDIVGRGGEYTVFMLGSDLEDRRTVRFFSSFHRLRVSRGIRIRLLSQERFRGLVDRLHRHVGMNIRFTRQEIPLGTFIFKNHVMTVVWGGRPTAFVIKSKKNYEYYQRFFDDLWRSAKG